MIDINDVYYKYDDEFIALKNINLHVNEGESIALVGVNGSGKSTLMKLINGLIYPDHGSYRFEGDEINYKKLQNEKFSKQFHKKIGFVFQNSEVQLFCSNVYDEVAFGPRQMSMDENEVRERVEDTLKLLKIEKLRYRQPYHLSGGEKKKVAIASVVVLNPDVYIFDEPMSGLDPRTKRFLREFMININAAGKTIICSTHDFEYVKGVFKRAVVFSKGHTIIRDGAYDEIMCDTRFLYDNNII
ncbi:ABC transporter ATP-binding protein [Clostridium fermenticellae]|uniref:ABC transporter ATP-binding protein n=1 Tax=Clostridium fermenticellae TaxID=2068654 RepID=A0A386H1F0_9CLOT|nr:ABC transporter ATP-binding protein [Clostridium fermenticellae]AYD39398.1 ABC transporter ATP-binding protein [Clostridium fermenticellae]